MKKSLLLLLAVMVQLSIMNGQLSAQELKAYSLKQKAENCISREKNFVDKENTTKYTSSKPKQQKSGIVKKGKGDELKKYYISSSGNVYTLLVESSTCLTASQKTNTIMFTHRGNPAKGLGTVSGNIISSYSQDGGLNWEQINITGSDEKGNRYPSGVLYNPQGNTDYKNTYSVITGPTTGGTEWEEVFYGSAKLDSTNFNVQYVTKETYLQSFPRYGMASCDDGKVHVFGYSYYDDALDSVVWKNGIMNNGSFDETNKRFTWTRVEIKQNFYNNYYNSFNTAWSQDGQIGYVYFMGIDSADNYQANMPIVYKSIDKGQTWDKMPSYDFSELKPLTDKVWRAKLIDTVNEHKTIPFFKYENDAVVDSDGNLHIFGFVSGSFTDNPDSLGWVYTYEPQKIFDVYTTSTGWGAELIDTVMATSVAASESGFGSGTTATGWNHRLQASRTEDGNKLFVIWTDTDTSLYKVASNFYPNIIAVGKDIKTGYRTYTKNFTVNTVFEGDNFWNYTGNITLKDGTKYRIPVTTSKTTSSPEDSVAHFFLSGIYFNEGDFVTKEKVNEINGRKDFTVAQNYPNPFRTLTAVSVRLNKPSEVSLEVRNLLGQKVYEIGRQRKQAGEHVYTIKGGDLEPGIYFYTVKVNQDRVTKKMIIK